MGVEGREARKRKEARRQKEGRSERRVAEVEGTHTLADLGYPIFPSSKIGTSRRRLTATYRITLRFSSPLPLNIHTHGHSSGTNRTGTKA